MGDAIKRLLIVEDDLSIREMLRRSLTNANFEVAAVGDAPDALRHIQRFGIPHLVILDLGLPTMNGFELSKRLKSMGDIPIVFLTAEDDEDIITRGIQDYAEDYLVKPVGGKELAARIRRILSRLGENAYTPGTLLKVDARVSLDVANMRIIVDHVAVVLTPIEARLLWVLVNNAPHVVQNDTLLERVWGFDGIAADALRVNISRLRRKFVHPEQMHEYIQNERGIGYRFVFPES